MSTIIICRCCMLEQELPEGVELMECPACGTRNSRPQATGAALEVFQRAVRQRMRCDFHNAENSYQHVLLDHPEEHEALWGLALCRYGVEYVEDPKKHRPMPVVHTTRRKPMQEDPDFLQACELAPEEIRRQYEADAAYIDQAQAEIRQLAESCPPFDVFLCHKTTMLDGPGYTEDYSRGMKLYHRLKERGYRVFFAPESMEGVAAGADYEAGIYHALCTAKVMLVICSKPEHLSSAWVQNEWQRYLEIADETDDHALVPLLYADMRASALPRAFRVRKLQGVRMGEMDSWEMTLNAVVKYAGIPVKMAAPVQPVPVPVPVQQPVPAPVPVQPRPVPAAPAPQPEIVEEGDFRIRVNPGRDGCAIEAYTGRDSRVIVPGTIGGWPVQGVWRNAFRPEQGLTAIELPETVRYIPGGVFADIPGLTLHVQAGSPAHLYAQKAGIACVTGRLPRPAMEEDFHTGYDPAGCVINGYFGNETEVIVPRIIHGKPVARIGVSAFPSSVRIIRLPDGLQSIAGMAFTACRELTEVEIPASVTAIGGYAFPDNDELTLRVQQGSFAYRYAREKGIRIAGEAVETPASAPAEDGEKRQALEELAGLLRLRAAQLEREAAIQANAPAQAMEHSRFSPEAYFEIMTKGEICAIRRYTGPGGSVVIPPSIRGSRVEGIWNGAFADTKGLTSIEIPATVRHIGDTAFSGIPGLTLRVYSESPACQHAREHDIAHEVLYEARDIFRTEKVEGGCAVTGYTGPGGFVMVPEEIDGVPVRRISRRGFAERADVTGVVLPDGLTVIGEGAFHGCTALKEVTLPEGLHDIGEGAFRACTALGSISLPRSLRSIGMQAFLGSALQEIRLPDSLQTLGAAAFSQCASLRTATLPGHLAVIPAQLFADCRMLATVSMADSVRAIGVGAFRDCRQLSQLTLPAALEQIGEGAFSGCVSLEALAIPSGVKALPVRAFHGCAGLKHIGLSHGLEAVGAGAFAGCESLQLAALPSSVSELGEGAFSGCTSLASFSLPAGVVRLNREMFKDCVGLQQVTLPQGLIAIGEQAFARCGLQKLVMPDTMRAIGKSAFYACDALREIRFSPALQHIAEAAFRFCSGLARVELPDGVTAIAASAFADCPALAEVVLPRRLTAVSFNLFGKCEGLRSVTLPDGLTAIGASAFTGCSSLHALTLPSKLAAIGEKAFYASGLREISIPVQVKTLEEFTFSRCRQLTAVILPYGLTTIKDGAFEGCENLERINISGEVRNIGKSVFFGCPKLPGSVRKLSPGSLMGFVRKFLG